MNRESSDSFFRFMNTNLEEKTAMKKIGGKMLDENVYVPTGP